MSSRVAAVLCAVVILATVASSYIIKPTGIAVVGSAPKGSRLWKPSGAIHVSSSIGAFRLSTSDDACREAGGVCNTVAGYTMDNGQSFAVDLAATGFCGNGGVLDPEAPDSVRCALDTPAQSQKEGYLAVKQTTFEFIPGGLLSSAKVVVKDHPTAAYFAFPNGSASVSIRLGTDIAYFVEKAVHVRNAEVQLENGTAVHVFYKSANLGESWEFVSFVPFPLGQESAIHRLGETKLMLLSGVSGNYTQATSVFLGSRWEKVEPATFATPLTTYVSKYQTSLYGGLRGRPGVTAMAAGPKKGSEKPIDLTDMHNRMVTKNPDLGLVNFSFEYRNTTAFECIDAPFSSAPEDGCASSSYVALLNLEDGTVFAIYDKVANYGPAASTGDNIVLALQLSLNETKEETEQQEKIQAAAKRAEREKAAEEARQQAQKENLERKKRERREKNRKDKARRAEFAELDAMNIEEARSMAKEDGETVVVRTVDTTTADIEKDTFFF